MLFIYNPLWEHLPPLSTTFKMNREKLLNIDMTAFLFFCFYYFSPGKRKYEKISKKKWRIVEGCGNIILRKWGEEYVHGGIQA